MQRFYNLQLNRWYGLNEKMSNTVMNMSFIYTTTQRGKKLTFVFKLSLKMFHEIFTKSFDAFWGHSKIIASKEELFLPLQVVKRKLLKKPKIELSLLTVCIGWNRFFSFLVVYENIAVNITLHVHSFLVEWTMQRRKVRRRRG